MASAGEQRALRDAAVRRLVELSASEPLTRQQVALAAEGIGVTERTMWRWVAVAASRADRVERARFVLDGRAAAAAGVLARQRARRCTASWSRPRPTAARRRRAYGRCTGRCAENLTPGDRAGLRKGERRRGA